MIREHAAFLFVPQDFAEARSLLLKTGALQLSAHELLVAGAGGRTVHFLSSMLDPFLQGYRVRYIHSFVSPGRPGGGDVESPPHDPPIYAPGHVSIPARGGHKDPDRTRVRPCSPQVHPETPSSRFPF